MWGAKNAHGRARTHIHTNAWRMRILIFEVVNGDRKSFEQQRWCALHWVSVDLQYTLDSLLFLPEVIINLRFNVIRISSYIIYSASQGHVIITGCDPAFINKMSKHSTFCLVFQLTACCLRCSCRKPQNEVENSVEVHFVFENLIFWKHNVILWLNKHNRLCCECLKTVRGTSF